MAENTVYDCNFDVCFFVLFFKFPLYIATQVPILACADPGIFVRGGGGPGQSDKKALTTFFFL